MVESESAAPGVRPVAVAVPVAVAALVAIVPVAEALVTVPTSLSPLDL